MSNNYEEIVNTLCECRGFPFNINIHFEDKINIKTLSKYLSETTIKKYKNTNFLSDNNGIALPFENNGYHIIIKSNLKDNYSTIAHETTHIIDYYEFTKSFNNGDLEIENNFLYPAFYLFSEFNARFVGHTLALQNIEQKDIEISDLSKNIRNEYETIKDNFTMENIYEMMQLLGRWFAIEFAMKKSFELPCCKNLYKALVEFFKNWQADKLYELNNIIFGY